MYLKMGYDEGTFEFEGGWKIGYVQIPFLLEAYYDWSKASGNHQLFCHERNEADGGHSFWIGKKFFFCFTLMKKAQGEQAET